MYPSLRALSNLPFFVWPRGQKLSTPVTSEVPSTGCTTQMRLAANEFLEGPLWLLRLLG